MELPTTSTASRRSPNICAQCRARKVRCDGQQSSGCANCRRLGDACSFRDPAIAGQPVARRRGKRACLRCYRRKARCSGDSPSCQRCQKLDVECVYVPAGRPQSTNQPLSPSGESNQSDIVAAASTATEYPPLEMESSSIDEPRGCTSPACPNPDPAINRSMMPPEPLMQRALAQFFRHLHYLPVFAVLQQASVMERYRAGILDDALTLAIAGIATSFLDLGPETKQLGAGYIDAAESIVVADREVPSIPRVQALIFIIKHRIACRRFSSVFMLTAIAVRFALALRLNYEDPNMPFLAQEGCRRTMWSLFMIDTTLAAGYRDFTLCPAEIMHIRLPCHDRNFKLDLPQTVARLQVETSELRNHDLGSLALTIRVMWLRHRVLQFSKKAAASEVSHLEQEIHSFQAELDSYLSSLPSPFQLSETNIRLHAYSTSLPAFAMIHVMWLGTHCILYRLAIDGFKEALPSDVLKALDPRFIAHCQDRCLESSRKMIELFINMLSLKLDVPVMDVDIGVSAYQAARILSHLWRVIPEVVSIDEFLEQTACCLDFLKTMCIGSNALEHIVSTLLSSTS
ncbi:hypothetical protein GQ53DRAFT_882075 [Thozetella sp. PMI_491]|nr:hypothetical protein GQ53DRAFT_882075 [Thozetella sp. PMI_491]